MAELNSFLTDIADAIRSKKGTTEKINASNFASEIEKIQTGIEPTGTLDITENGEHNVREYEKVNVNVESQGGNTLKTLLDNTKNSSYLFYEYSGNNLSDLIQYNDTENVTNFKYMFRECSNATSFPLIDTSKGTDFSYMFRECSNATSFPLIDTSNGNLFLEMFYGCSNATSFPLINTSKGTNVNKMFANCPKAKKIEISYYNITSTSYCASFCGWNYSLKAVIIRSFGLSYVLNTDSFNNCYHLIGYTNSTYNPNGDKDCYIYVPRDMIETLSSATNWSAYATQFRALEDYTKDGTTTGEFDDVKAGLV